VFQAIHSGDGKLQAGRHGIEEATVRFVGQLVEMQFNDVSSQFVGRTKPRPEPACCNLTTQTRDGFTEQFKRIAIDGHRANCVQHIAQSGHVVLDIPAVVLVRVRINDDEAMVFVPIPLAGLARV